MSTDPVDHARAYPFAEPEGSYLLGADGPRWLAGERADMAGRTAVLASGSNRSPERLLVKFKGLLAEPILVTAVEVTGADAVYSAHFSAYGSIPATLYPAPGVVVHLFATWLTDGQLARMHDTEALGRNYDFARLAGLAVRLEDGTVVDDPHAYIGRRGALSVDGRPVALAEIQARGRAFTAMSQDRIQAHARDRLAPNTDIRAFIGENVSNAVVRRERTRRLASDACRDPFPGADVLAP